MTIQVKNFGYVYFLPRNDNMYLTFTSTYIGVFQKHRGSQWWTNDLLISFRIAKVTGVTLSKEQMAWVSWTLRAMTSEEHRWLSPVFGWMIWWFCCKKLNSIWVGNMISTGRNRSKGLWRCVSFNGCVSVCFAKVTQLTKFAENAYIYIWIRTFVPWVCPYRHALTVLF